MNNGRKRMVEILPAKKQGGAEIRHFNLDEETCKWANLGYRIRGQHFMVSTPGEVCQLLVNGSLMMSDTDMEWRTNSGFISRAHGNVLIAGLGLGFILFPVCAKPEVKSVTVVEKSADVIGLVTPHVAHPKISVINEDIFKAKEIVKDRGPFDCIYFDIWPDLCRDNLKEMQSLERRYRPLLKKTDEAWIGSWAKSEIKAYA